MSRKNIFLSFISTLFLSLGIFLLSSRYNKKIPIIKILPSDVSVTAQVGEYAINSISGWTTPFAVVELNSPGLARKTNADEKGFFIFTDIPVRKSTSEICLFSQDPLGVAANPVCLAPQDFLDGMEIKDILLPPTILVDKEKFSAGETSKATGMTFPNSEVVSSLFSGKKAPETVKAKSNENGKFEIHLPNKLPSKNSIYVFSNLNPVAASALNFIGTMSSPKSNILTYFILIPFWYYLIPFLLLLLIFLGIIFFYLRNYKTGKELIIYEPRCETKFISGRRTLRF